jgi:MBG domain (YGX type)
MYPFEFPDHTGSATGVKGEALSNLLHLGDSFTNVPGGTAAWTFDGNTNYKSATGSAAITISRAALIVTPDNFSRFYGDPNPAFTGKVSGIKNGDNITATYSTSATAATPAGSYDITATSGGYIFNLKTSGLKTGTYNINFTVVGASNSSYTAPFGVK